MSKLREAGRFLGSLFVLVGIFVYLIAGLSAYQRSKALRQLPTLSGTALEGFVYNRSGELQRVHLNSYGVRWMVRYRLQNSIFVSTADLGYSSPSWHWAEYMKGAFPAGSAVKVYYDPVMFGRIAISGDTFRQRQPVAFALVLLATALVIVGVCLSLLSIERRQA